MVNENRRETQQCILYGQGMEEQNAKLQNPYFSVQSRISSHSTDQL